MLDSPDGRIRTLKSPISHTQLEILPEQCQIVQFEPILSEEELELVSEYLRGYPDIELRLFAGSNYVIPNLTLLEYFPFIQKLSIDIKHLKSYEGIAVPQYSIKILHLGDTRPEKLSIEFLGSFKRLRELSITGYKHHIDVIDKLQNLEKLALRSLVISDLNMLAGLDNLWWLSVTHGSLMDISQLRELPNLKYLKLRGVRSLTDLSPISDLQSLQYLHLQSLKAAVKLPDFSRLQNLRRLHLERIRAIRDLTPILKCPNLKELVIQNSGHLTPVNLQPLAEHQSLKRLSADLKNERKNMAVRKLLPFDPVQTPPSEFIFTR